MIYSSIIEFLYLGDVCRQTLINYSVPNHRRVLDTTYVM